MHIFCGVMVGIFPDLFVPVKATIRKLSSSKFKAQKDVGVTNCSTRKPEMHAKHFCPVGNLSVKRKFPEKGTNGIP